MRKVDKQQIGKQESTVLNEYSRPLALGCVEQGKNEANAKIEGK